MEVGSEHHQQGEEQHEMNNDEGTFPAPCQLFCLARVTHIMRFLL
jgi:hypothetical protein